MKNLSDRGWGITEELEGLRGAGLWREMLVVESAVGARVMVNGHEKVVFCSNNYLGLANHEKVIEAVKKGVEEWGVGAGGSRLICGNTAIHERLEGRLAELLGKEASLIFPSGYAANGAILACLAGKGDLVVLDKLVHASLIDGARASGAKVRTWQHGQVGKLRRLLEKGGYKKVLVVSDSLFSMDGDFADLAELVEVKNEFGALLMVDEAHAFGCVGPDGAGVAAEQGVLGEVDVFVGTFSKALGSSGGFVVCSAAVRDYLVNKARGFIFTTALPVVNCLAAEAALEVAVEDEARRERLMRNGEYLRAKLAGMGLNIGDSMSYIVPVMVGDAERAVRVSEQLYEAGLWVPAIRPPTVGRGGSRLRISVMSEHGREDMDRLCEELKNA